MFMPADSRDTIKRQWQLLHCIPSYRQNPTGMEVKELTNNLEKLGFHVDKRTVQRDLNELSRYFPLYCNDKSKPHGWRWQEDAHVNLCGLSVGESVALNMVENHLRQMLPPGLLTGMNGLFRQAEKQLKALQESNNTVAGWLPKVRNVPATLPLLPPKVDEKIHDTLSKALMEGRQLRVIYRKASAIKNEEYILHPLGIFLRGQTPYLVARTEKHTHLLTLPFHRFKEAEMLDEPVSVPPDFNLDTELGKGMAEFGNGTQIKLELSCNDDLAFHLGETPLSADQTMEKLEEDDHRISATVNDTMQLRWWLLAQGAQIEVLAPESLREEIAEKLNDAAEIYADSDDE
jgi:predicted DNA-binding transcriptional regulator YafY